MMGRTKATSAPDSEKAFGNEPLRGQETTGPESPNGRKLRVLFDLTPLSTRAVTRGVGRYVTELALALHKEQKGRTDLEILGTFELPLLSEPRISSDIPSLLEELQKPKVRSSTLWATKVRLSLGRAARKAGVNLVHSPDPSATPFRLPCPRVVTCHHVSSLLSQSEWHGASAGESERERRRFSRADHVIAISTATAGDLIARLDVPRDRISVVDNGISLERFSTKAAYDDEERRAVLGVKRGTYLLCVGGADERKNVAGILMGLARASKITGRADLKLVWAGSLGRAEQVYLDDLAEDAGVERSLSKVGYVSDRDLAALYRGALALVFPSLREGFGYPVVEALASGTPVITSNRGSLRYVSGDAAILVDPSDREAIADAIVLVAEDSAERETMKIRGPLVAARFGSEKMARETILVYEAVSKAFHGAF